MKKLPFLFLVVASFIGVLLALQVDHYLSMRSDHTEPIVFGTGQRIVPIDYQTAGSPADFRAAAKRVTPSVVSVDQYTRVQSFMDQEPRLQETGQGSGVIISQDGVIVTNNHVVQDVNDPSRIVDEVRVRLGDKRVFKAEVVGRDSRTDLAVLRIKATGLAPIAMGDSSTLAVGQWVIAVGNPLGFENTVSVGVVSSLGRSLGVERGLLLDAIQTDAAINMGNSGGALTDAQGQLIGINSAIATNNQGSIGIGFAIPVNRMRQVVGDILKVGHARHAGLGVTLSAAVLQDPRVRTQYEQTVGVKPPDHGVMIGGLTASGSAEKAGVQQYDILLSVDSVKLDDYVELNKQMINHRPGDKISLTYWSRGKVKTVNLTLQEIPSE